MRMTRMGAVIFAAGIAGFGVLCLVTGDSELFWKLFPGWVSGRGPVAGVTGVLLLAGGLGMLVPRTARFGTLVVTAVALLWLLALGVPRALAHPTNELVWLNFGQNLILVAGGWTLLGSLPGRGGIGVRSGIVPSAPRLALILYAVALPMVGLSHFVYVKAAVAAVPRWLPYRPGFAYLAGTGHIAAGLGILFGVLPRLAATAEAAMLTLFAVLVSIPGIAASPAVRDSWTALFITTTDAGAAWIIAGALQGLAWGLAQKRAARSESPAQPA